MKTPLLVLSLLFIASLSSTPAHANVCGETMDCVTSFSISGTILGDNAHWATATATVQRAPNSTGPWYLELRADSGVHWKCAPPAIDAPPGGLFGYAGGCKVTTGNTVTAYLWGANSGTAPVNFAVNARAGYNPEPGIDGTLTVLPVPDPAETPDHETDMPCATCGDAGSPINVTNGNTWITEQDYSIPGLGGGLTLARTWNSLWTLTNPPEVSGIFGHSWRSTFEERIQVLTGGVVRYWKGDGSSLFYSYSGSGGVYVMTAPLDDQTALSFDSGTTLWTASLKNGTQKIFNSAGYLTSITDRNGNSISVNVDSANQNRIASVTDAAARTLTFHYDNSSFPRLCTSITDASGTMAAYVYNSSGLLTQVNYPDGAQLNFTYNGQNLILSVTDTLSKVLEAHTYDSQRRGLTSRQANDSSGHPVNLVTVSYGSMGNNFVTDSTGAYGTSVQVFTLGQRHYVAATSGSYGCATCRFSGYSQSVFLDSGYKLAASDSNGNTSLYTYDGQGNTLSQSKPTGDPTTNLTGYNTWNYTYNAFGEVLTVTDPLGNTTTNAYDVHGNLLSTTTPSPDGGATPASTTSFTYDSHGQLLTVTNPLSHVTTLSYDSNGMIHTISDAQSHVTTYAYDVHGNRTSVTDATSHQTQFAYDSMNRLTQITYPDSSTVQFAYDYRGRRTSVTDQNSKVTSYGYDDADRLVSVTDASSHTTTYGYNTENNLTDVYDARGNHTHFGAYDGPVMLGDTFPSGYGEAFAWDRNGNLTVKIDRNGNQSNYYYDYQNRLARKYGQVLYTYDAAGRLTQVSDYNTTGTYSFTYDNMNRLKSVTTDYSFDSHGAYTVQYGYDAASNRTSMTDPQSGVTTYSYDSLNRLSNLQDPQSHNFGFSYDALSRRTQLTRPNGVNTNYSYDNLSRLLSVLHQVGSTTLDGASYTYDAAGNRTAKTDQLASVTSNYAYDAIYQLTGVTQGASTTESYSYDAVGNRLSSLGVSPYAYNSSNELTSTPSTSYTYDANGNTLSDAQGRSFTWDFESRLTQVVNPGVGTTNFRYDPFGRRVQKSGPSGTTNFVYDGHNVLEEVDSTGNVLARYTQPEYLDEPLGQLRSGTTSYYQQDALRSVTSLSNGAGAVAKTYSFDSFGNTTASTGTLVNPFQYTGREFDSETGLFFNRARYFDPLRGRFISEDPARFFGGLNFYTYVDNDPVDWTDPTGLKTYECTAPLHAAPKLYHKLPLMYHEYLCVVGQDGKPVCVGQDRSGSAVWSPGKPSDDTMEGGSCKQKDPDDQCIEQCILAEGAKPRPQYGIGPQGTDCQEWADDTLSKCEKQCGKKKGWSIF